MSTSLIISGCQTTENDEEVTPTVNTVVNGSTAASTSTIAVGSTECPYGGIQVKTGIDKNGNGSLDTAEVDNTEYVCNGAAGNAGAAGNTGTNALIKILTESKGSNCVAGGLRIHSGLDDNRSGELEIGEFDATSYLCGTWDYTASVTIANGDIRGAKDATVKFYRGIPFAKPPVGALRWTKPQTPADWTGTRDATKSGNICTQRESIRTWQETGKIVGNEDCLYLDVYRPNNDVSSGMPVYFYIHGGSNTSGSAADYDGSAMAAELNMVVVITQYRLGPLGWFRNADLRAAGGDATDDSGNYGTLDHIKALEWVKSNIAQFGGNPNNVTIAGESAGAHNVQNLLIASSAGGLFHRAISQSGAYPISDDASGDVRTDGTITALGSDTLAALGSNYKSCTDGTADCLRAETTSNILNARKIGDGNSLPTVSAYADGTVLPIAWPSTFASTVTSGTYNKVPVIFGANTHEMRTFMPLFPIGKWGKVYDLFDTSYDPEHKWTFEEIFPTEDDYTLYQTCAKYGSENWRAKYVDEMVNALKNEGNGTKGVYAYLFNWGEQDVGPENFNKVFGATHAMDISFFMGSDDSLFGYSFTKANKKGREALRSAMMTYVAQFAMTGDPNDGTGTVNGTASIPTWSVWTADSGGRIIFDANKTELKVAMSTGDYKTSGAVLGELAALTGSWTGVLSYYKTIPFMFMW